VTRTVLVLDDDPQREREFAQAVENLRDAQLLVRSTSAEFLADARGRIALPDVVSLDHDLLPEDSRDGMDVVRTVVGERLLPGVPFIVHSSNSDRAAMMMGELELDGRGCHRVLPFGES